MSQEIQNVACPVCGITGFSASGLRHHRCRKTPERRRLTSREYVDAIAKAKAEQASSANRD